MTIWKWVAAAGALAAVSLLAACGGGADRTKAQVRLVNASSGYSELDWRVDDELRQGAVAYGQTAGYAEADPGKTNTLARAGSGTALLTFNPAVDKRKHYTLLAYGPQGGLKQLLLDDEAGAPADNRSQLRVVNAAPDAGALDIYLTGTADTLAESVPVQSGAAVDAIGAWLTVNSGTWRLRVTATGSKTDLRLDVSSLSLASKQVATLVIAPAAGGVLVQGLVLTQQGAVTALAPSQARLRIVSGLADAGSVNLRLGGAAVLSNVSAPAVTPYTLVPAGEQAVLVTVNGTTLPDSSFTLTAGADYTLLIYGPADAALVNWVVDDNNLPTDRTQAKLRLVNGVAGLSGALSMSADFAPVADGLAAGAASAYGVIDATSTAQLSVTVAGSATALFSAVDQSFAAAANYTVFLVGNPESPVGIVRKDR
ncbi:MAG: DUF4397 domain-containing protein [Rubrivivax sp.]|nr:DUF4397 domain-containing protein [Rubrivivax sp.]